MADHRDHGHAAPGAFVPGTMDTRPQERAFAGLIRATRIVVVAVILILLFLALVNG